MASITRKSEKTVATVTATSKKIAVSVSEKLTIAESKELRALLKAAEKDAEGQSAWGGHIASRMWLDEATRYRF